MEKNEKIDKAIALLDSVSCLVHTITDTMSVISANLHQAEILIHEAKQEETK